MKAERAKSGALKRRSPEAQLAYLDGYMAGIRFAQDATHRFISLMNDSVMAISVSREELRLERTDKEEITWRMT